MKIFSLRYRSGFLLAMLVVVARVSAGGEERVEGLVDSGLSGKQLVQKHCTRCHLAPDPADLPKEFWPMALYNMGSYMGMKGNEFSELTVEQPPPNPDWYAVFHKVANKKGEHYNPYIYYDFSLPKPIITKAEWLRIKDYFVTNAPPNEQLKIRRPNAPVLKGFRPVIPTLDLEPNGWVLATAVDPARRRIFVGRAAIADEAGGLDPDSPKDLLVFDLDTGKRLAQTPLDSLPVHLETTPTGARLSTHGHFYITRSEGGISQIIDWDLSGQSPRVRMLANGLDRLTHHHTIDMNGDGLKDIVVNAYGDGIFELPGGLLAVFWQTPDYAALWREAPAELPRTGPMKGAFRETVLDKTAGIIDSVVADFNNDGQLDIAAMIAQGKQQVLVYLNEGNETFTKHVVAEYRPSYGGNSIQAADLDGDGYTDIVAIYGDGPAGGEVTPGHISVTKPRHGIRLLKNNGDMTFSEKLHYPMSGAIRSVTRDFDGDGDVDIAVIALYPDWSRKEPETFVYLENEGDWQFKAASLGSDAFGLWSSIEAADVNADGKPDIVLGLGNASGFAPANWTDRERMAGSRGRAPTVLFLLNEHN